MKVEFISETDIDLESLIAIEKLIGKRVLSKNGLVIGRIKSIRINKNEIEGILVSPGILKKKIYISSTYFNKLTGESVLLNIDPSILNIGKRVLNDDGNYLGKVSNVTRREYSNSVYSISVKKFLRKEIVVPGPQIKSVGQSIILKNTYNAPKKHFWQIFG